MKFTLSLIFYLCSLTIAFAQGEPVVVGTDSSVTISGNLTSVPIAFADDRDNDPNVAEGSNFVTANTSATTLDDFIGYADGKAIYILIGDAITTFDFTTSGLEGRTSDYLALDGEVLGFIYSTVDDQWHLISGVGVTSGDVSTSGVLAQYDIPEFTGTDPIVIGISRAERAADMKTSYEAELELENLQGALTVEQIESGGDGVTTTNFLSEAGTFIVPSGSGNPPVGNDGEIQIKNGSAFAAITGWESDGTSLTPEDGAELKLATELVDEEFAIAVFDTGVASAYTDGLKFVNQDPPYIQVGVEMRGFTGLDFQDGPVRIELGTNPTIANTGEIAVDINDDMFKFYTTSGEKGISSRTVHSTTIYEPDTVNATIPIFECDAEVYPHGCEIIKIAITTSEDGVYTLPFWEWSLANPSVQEIVLNTGLTTGAADRYAHATPPSNAILDSGDRVMVVVPVTDIAWVMTTIVVEAIQGD